MKPLPRFKADTVDFTLLQDPRYYCYLPQFHLAMIVDVLNFLEGRGAIWSREPYRWDIIGHK